MLEEIRQLTAADIEVLLAEIWTYECKKDSECIHAFSANSVLGLDRHGCLFTENEEAD